MIRTLDFKALKIQIVQVMLTKYFLKKINNNSCTLSIKEIR